MRILFADGLSDTAVEWLRAGGHTGTLKPSLTADEPREELLDAVRAWSDGIQASNLHA